MKILSTIIFLFAIFITSNAQNIVNIDLTRAKFEETNVDKIFKDIKIIPLETHTDALLKKNCTYYLTDKYIIAVQFLQGAYLFDRKTGTFIREISSVGQGPNEYTGYIYHKYGFDERNKMLFANIGSNSAKLWQCINVESNKRETNLNKPLPKSEKDFFLAYAPWLIRNNIYVSFCNNGTGKDKTRLVVYNREGTILKKYPNYLEYQKEEKNSYPANNGIFYYYNNSTYFKEWCYNDTVFRVDEKSMIPRIIFKSGTKKPSYYPQEDLDYNRGKYLIDFVYESNRYVLFSFFYFSKVLDDRMKTVNYSIYPGYYDKSNKQAYISSTSDFKRPGFIISGIPVRFYPISINSKKEMIAQIDPEEIIKYRDQLNPKYKSLFKDIQEDDNPIVIIAKLKE